jgi:hydroxyacyl-ACP dehydratase HTD2-like protein with hotdog domain
MSEDPAMGQLARERPVVRRFGEVAVGAELPTLVRTPTRLTLFLFGVAYWTSHRIHYDVDWARAEGFADVLVTANLISAYSAELATTWAGAPGCLRALRERNLNAAFAGEELTVGGRVAALEPGADGGLVRCALWVTKADRTVVVDGHATLHLPA